MEDIRHSSIPHDKSVSKTQNSYPFDQFHPKYQHQEVERLKRTTDVMATVDRAAWHQAGLRQGFRVLDLGCGAGSVTQRLAEAAYPGDVIGADISERMVHQATTDCVHPNLRFEKADAYQLHFSDNCFDMVHARFLFQHLQYPLKALQEIYRVLKPGGSLCAIDVDDHWFTLYPEPKSTEPFRQQILAIQKQKGGDPFVGRKLFSYFHKAALEQVQNRIRILSTDDHGTDRLISLLSFGAPYYGDHPKFAEIAKQARKDISETIKTDKMWVSLGIFTATGQKSL